jgi:hypothetical protein
MTACKFCGACLWDEVETKGGPNQGRMYLKCRQCEKFGGFVDGQPSLKPAGGSCYSTQYGKGPTSPFESKASFQSPAYSPPAKSDPIPIPASLKRPRDDDDEEPQPKRSRFSDGFSEAMLSMMAGVGSLIARFDQAAANLEKICLSFKEKDAEGNPKN